MVVVINHNCVLGPRTTEWHPTPSRRLKDILLMVVPPYVKITATTLKELASIELETMRSMNALQVRTSVFPFILSLIQSRGNAIQIAFISSLFLIWTTLLNFRSLQKPQCAQFRHNHQQRPFLGLFSISSGPVAVTECMGLHVVNLKTDKHEHIADRGVAP